MTKQSIQNHCLKNGLPRYARNDGFTLADIRCKKQSVCTDYPNGQTLTPALSHRRGSKYAFTLAEVLITLVIIGVIAAITVPTLITKYQKEQTVTRLKKAYSALSQTTQRAIADNGPIETWETTTTTSFLKKYIKPYLNISQDCETNNNSSCSYTYTYLDNSGSVTVSELAKKNIFYLSDGTLIYAYKYNPDEYLRIELYIDINGQKKPNKMGKDLFIIFYYIDYPAHSEHIGKFVPSTHLNSRESILSEGGWGCSKTGKGASCLTLIMKDGWRIADDYPW